MKTVRELLLQKHQTADRPLDQIRREVVSGLRPKEQASPLILTAWLKLWRELFVPARLAWGSIAAGWLVIGLLNVIQTDPLATAVNATAVTSQELRVAREQKRELLREMALLPIMETIEAPKPHLQPRSARRPEYACA